MKTLITLILGMFLSPFYYLYSYEIVLGMQPGKAEQTAVTELKYYLEKVIEKSFYINGKEAVIYVGDTDFARQNKVYATSMPEENYVIRTVGNGLILAGGGERGTLYAVYRFLEDIMGIHWFNQFEDSLPPKQDIHLQELNINWKPLILQRDIYRSFNNIPKDKGRFCARNRLNRDGDYPIAPEYGGSFTFGSPYFTHTFARYFPKEKYYTAHPEYFAMNKGKRIASATSQLCLTNTEMLREAVRLMKDFILKDEMEAKEKGCPSPLIYDFSNNDSRNPCECGKCRKLSETEESEAGPLLYAINYIADEIAKFRPSVYVSTLAYYHTERPPRTLRPRDNVIIRLCDTSTNQARDFSAPENLRFLKILAAWAKISKNLAIWDYSITYPTPSGPYPHEYTLAENIRQYRKNRVMSIFGDHEGADSADFYDMNVWLEARLMEEPERDVNTLINTYMQRNFGAAATEMLQYRHLLNQSVIRNKTYIDWFAPPAAFNHIDLETAVKAQQLFDTAESKVSGTELERVQRARVNLDRICMLRLSVLAKEHFANGGTEQDFPFERKKISTRARDRWIAMINKVISVNNQAVNREKANQEFRKVQVLPLVTHMNPEFAKKKTKIYDFTADQFQIWGKNGKLISDPEADARFAFCVPMTWKYNPDNILSCGMYIPLEQKHAGGRSIKAKEIIRKGYQLFRIGRIIPRQSAYLYMLPDWTLQIKLDSVVANMHDNDQFDVYISARFTGPVYPHGNAKDKNAIYVERVILERVRQ